MQVKFPSFITALTDSGCFKEIAVCWSPESILTLVAFTFVCAFRKKSDGLMATYMLGSLGLIFLSVNWKSRYFHLYYLFEEKRKRKKNITMGTHCRLGKTEFFFFNLANVIWNCSCITLILIKCRMSSTAKLIPPRAKPVVLHLGRASPGILNHHHSGESAGLVNLKSSKTTWPPRALSSLMDRFVPRFILCGSRRGPSLPLVPSLGGSQPMRSNTFKDLWQKGFLGSWKAFKWKNHLERLNSGITCPVGSI